MWALYKSCKSQFNTSMKQARDNFINNIISTAFEESDSKPFWKFIRSKVKVKVKVVELLYRTECPSLFLSEGARL